MTLPKTSDEQKVNLFNRANNLRRQNEFDKAVTAYENILNLDSSSAEAHWGLVLSKYGIEYVKDPATGQRIPTCHRVQRESILTDADYLAALENAEDEYTKSLYEDEAKRIGEIQKGILAVSSQEAPYDVFICYKETTEGGSRTKDSALAQDLYYQLEKEGFKVFFSRVSLESKLGQQYEPYIFNALNSAKVMLVIGTKPEYFNAVWVKNEWSRFLALMKKDRSRLLIPCYRDMDAYDLPEEMAMLQSQDMGRIGFIQDIVHGIKKIVNSAKADVSPTASAGTTGDAPGVESLMKRGWLFLEDANRPQANPGVYNAEAVQASKQAVEYFNKVLDIDPEYAPAYVGLLCSKLRVGSEADLANHKELLDNVLDYQKALRYADADYRAKLVGYNETIKAIKQELQRRREEEQKQFAEEVLKEQLRREEEEQKDLQRRKQRMPELKRIREQNAKYCGCISAGNRITIALEMDGTVDVAGDDQSRRSTYDWRDIVAVAAGDGIVGLKVDGTLITPPHGLLHRSDIFDSRDIIAVSMGNNIVAIKSDGTSEGCNGCWRDIIAVSEGYDHTLGLKSDGTVVALSRHGNNSEYMLKVSAMAACNTGSWRDIVAISAGRHVSVGLKADGTVIMANEPTFFKGVMDWRDIVAVSTRFTHIVGLKADGTVVAAGSNGAECNTGDWRDIVAVSAGHNHTVGLKSDGTVVAVGDNRNGQCNTDGWKIGPVNKVWLKQGLCRNCGGQIGGLLTKKCKSCGMPSNIK